jgi:DNA-binding MarR family transcriptional regulator
MKPLLTQRQYEVLKILSSRPQWSVSEIARALQISNAAATKCVRRLEKHGVIIRSNNLRDHRSYIIRMTQEGQQAIIFLTQHVYV